MVKKKYVVYELNRVMGSSSHEALSQVYFNYEHNLFDTEEEAIQAIKEHGSQGEEYLIITKIIII